MKRCSHLVLALAGVIAPVVTHAQALPAPILSVHEWQPPGASHPMMGMDVDTAVSLAAQPIQQNRPSLVSHLFFGALTGAAVGAAAGLVVEGVAGADAFVPGWLVGAVLGVPAGALGGFAVYQHRTATRRSSDDGISELYRTLPAMTR